MPNGERSVLGGQVIIERIGREDGGEYQCWDLVTNKTNTHKYVNVLCKYYKHPFFLITTDWHYPVMKPFCHYDKVSLMIKV